MDENKKVEVILTEQNEENVIVEEKKAGFVNKAGKWIKDNGLAILAVGAVGVISFLAGAHVAGNSEEFEYENCDGDTFDTDAYVVENTEEE